MSKSSARALNSAEMRTGADDFVENTQRDVEMSVTTIPLLGPPR